LKTDVTLTSLGSAVSDDRKHSRVSTGSPLAISRTRNGHLNHPVVNRGRNARWPTRGDPHGHGASVVVRGRESRPHGEGRQVSPGVRAEVGETCDAESRPHPGHPPRPAHGCVRRTGEPDAVKVASPVRRGAVGKGLPSGSTSLAAYPTTAGAIAAKQRGTAIATTSCRT